ncbi:MAG TPA: sigma-54 dependent transcriptional regulator [Terriglobales bacterium]|nr:sigma-54 dependent transcriptional regulator [Terriglobales bacterium]
MCLSTEDERSENSFQEIVGESLALQRMLKLAMKVALSDAPVLIFGEAGSGKESIARAVHRISPRRNESFVKVNCAPTADEMLESELFGNERGASDYPAGRKTGGIEPANPEPANKEMLNSDKSAVFPPDAERKPPGALTQPEFEWLENQLLGHEKGAEGKSRKKGYLELANKGILFLDEIAHVPLDLQAKLLRLLERREFERLGSTHSIPVNVRLIASTRYDLGERVAEQMFRGDLYDQLNVFPIRVPPLRERRDDIPLLARYFVQKFARRMNKDIETIAPETMDALLNYDWPGNVRQLENFIERSVIFTDGSTLQAPLNAL